MRQPEVIVQIVRDANNQLMVQSDMPMDQLCHTLDVAHQMAIRSLLQPPSVRVNPPSVFESQELSRGFAQQG